MPLAFIPVLHEEPPGILDIYRTKTGWICYYRSHCCAVVSIRENESGAVVVEYAFKEFEGGKTVRMGYEKKTITEKTSRDDLEKIALSFLETNIGWLFENDVGFREVN